MESERDRHGHQKPRIPPWWHFDQAGVLRKGIQRVEHLDRDQDGKRQCHCLHFANGEVVTRVRKRDGSTPCNLVWRCGEVLPGRTLTPIAKLRQLDECVPVASKVDAQKGSLCVPQDEDANSRNANI